MQQQQIAKPYEELIELLYTLDKELERDKPGKEFRVRIDAVGGFALLYHGLRVSDKKTRDIDMVNELMSWVWKIAYKIDNSNWLSDGPNTILHIIYPCVKDNLEFIKDAQYRFPNDHIELWVATLDSIVGLKLDSLRRAAEEGHSIQTTKRTQDFKDLREIFKLYQIDSTSSFIKEYPKLSPFSWKKYSTSDDFF